MADTRTDEQKAKDAIKFFNVLKDIRQPYEDMVDEVIKYVHHGRRKIKDKDMPKGKKTGMDVYDGTAISAANLATDGISGYSFSKSYRWFNYMLPGKLNFPRWSAMRAWSGKRMDQYPDVRLWLEDCEEVMYAAFLRSNFYDIGPEIVREALTIGTVNPIIEEDVSKGRIVFTVPHFRECYIAENRFGVVDTRYRVYKCDYRQMVDKFGMDQMKKAIPGFAEKYEKNPYTEVEILHAIFPRSDYDSSYLNGGNKPFASWWILMNPVKFLYDKKRYQGKDESGYDENPLLSWRWRKNSDEIYGRSPAWDAYVDIMKANQQGRTNLIAAHKSVEPPIVAPTDLRGKIEDAPRGRTYMDPTRIKDGSPRPLVTGMQLPFAVDAEERADKIIREHFHVDFFLMLWQAAMNKVEMTATQVVEMAGEKAAILGNRVGRMETEFGNPTHDRCFNIEARAGRIPMPPQILLDYAEKGKIEVDYLGPLAQAQKTVFKSKAMRAGVMFITDMANVYGEEVKDVIDPISYTREYLNDTGVPVRHLRSDDKIAEIRAERQAAIEAQQDVAEGIEMAKAASKLTRTVEPNSPLDMIMGGTESTP